MDFCIVGGQFAGPVHFNQGFFFMIEQHVCSAKQFVDAGIFGVFVAQGYELFNGFIISATINH